MWLVAGLVTWPFRNVLVYDTAWSWLGAAPCFAIGAGLYLSATRNFTTDQVLGRAELQPHKHEQRFVVSGIRERVRHPIYVGHFFELLGWAIGTGMAVLFALTAFAVVTGLIMVRAEDRELEARFGEQYREYRQRVPGLIPRLW
jgi:protein-S-isoprenylcysteine O-methyltransferase Ste14